MKADVRIVCSYEELPGVMNAVDDFAPHHNAITNRLEDDTVAVLVQNMDLDPAMSMLELLAPPVPEFLKA